MRSPLPKAALIWLPCLYHKIHDGAIFHQNILPHAVNMTTNTFPLIPDITIEAVRYFRIRPLRLPGRSVGWKSVYYIDHKEINL